MKRIESASDRKKLKKEAVIEANIFDSRKFMSLAVIGKNTTGGPMNGKLFARLMPQVQNKVYSQTATEFSKTTESIKTDDYYYLLKLSNVAELAENDIVLVTFLDVSIDTFANYLATNKANLASALQKLTKQNVLNGFNIIKTATTSHKDQHVCIVVGKIDGNSIAEL